jgi:hypothetical protein
MWIVAIAWIYVVGLMSLTETSFVAGVMTFVFYCLMPLSILYYLATTNKRRERHRSERAAGARQSGGGTVDNDGDGAADGGDGD